MTQNLTKSKTPTDEEIIGKAVIYLRNYLTPDEFDVLTFMCQLIDGSEGKTIPINIDDFMFGMENVETGKTVRPVDICCPSAIRDACVSLKFKGYIEMRSSLDEENNALYWFSVDLHKIDVDCEYLANDLPDLAA